MTSMRRSGRLSRSGGDGGKSNAAHALRDSDEEDEDENDEPSKSRARWNGSSKSNKSFSLNSFMSKKRGGKKGTVDDDDVGDADESDDSSRPPPRRRDVVIKKRKASSLHEEEEEEDDRPSTNITRRKPAAKQDDSFVPRKSTVMKKSRDAKPTSSLLDNMAQPPPPPPPAAANSTANKNTSATANNAGNANNGGAANNGASNAIAGNKNGDGTHRKLHRTSSNAAGGNGPNSTRHNNSNNTRGNRNHTDNKQLVSVEALGNSKLVTTTPPPPTSAAAPPQAKQPPGIRQLREKRLLGRIDDICKKYREHDTFRIESADAVDLAGSFLFRYRGDNNLSTTTISGRMTTDERYDFFDTNERGEIVLAPRQPVFPEEFPPGMTEQPLSWWGILDPVAGRGRFTVPPPTPLLSPPRMGAGGAHHKPPDGRPRALPNASPDAANLHRRRDHSSSRPHYHRQQSSHSVGRDSASGRR